MESAERPKDSGQRALILPGSLCCIRRNSLSAARRSSAEDWDTGHDFGVEAEYCKDAEGFILYARKMERVKGIEPSSHAWEARILPLNHTREIGLNFFCRSFKMMYR